MIKKIKINLALLSSAAVSCLMLLAAAPVYAEVEVRVKDISRIQGVRDNMLTGYGLVVGLAGTGDSTRSKATLQSVVNALKVFGLNVTSEDINSRNVAAVLLTTKLPAFSNAGNKLDVNVSSIGDARSLTGGTLLIAPLKAPNGVTYALAQGSLSVGGYSYDLHGNVVQKNHPTVGVVSGGATIERSTNDAVVQAGGKLHVILNSADYTNAGRIAEAINTSLGEGRAKASNAAMVQVDIKKNNVVDLVALIEKTKITPDVANRIVINERTGTIVAGGDIKINAVSISHGDLKVSIVTDFNVSQPTLVSQAPSSISSVVTPDTSVSVHEPVVKSVQMQAGASVSDLVSSLKQIKTSTRDMVAILQAMKSAGSLHAELVIQ